jgi:hypothetical protein
MLSYVYAGFNVRASTRINVIVMEIVRMRLRVRFRARIRGWG